MSTKLFDHLPALCNIVKRIAQDAGKITLEHYNPSGCAFDTKPDGSPVTVADRKAEDFIITALRDIHPDIKIMGEETQSHASPITDDYFWLVDALDGTREFIKGREDFTVNIALIKNHRPILGVVYAPVLGELYAGHGAGTAIRWLDDTQSEKSIRIRKPPRAGMTITISRFDGHRPKLDTFLETIKVEKMMKRGSSLKFCLIAAGKADLYPRFGTTGAWDTAAGQAILESAGGVVTNLHGTPLTYGMGDTWDHAGFLAHAGELDFSEALEN